MYVPVDPGVVGRCCHGGQVVLALLLVQGKIEVREVKGAHTFDKANIESNIGCARVKLAGSVKLTHLRGDARAR